MYRVSYCRIKDLNLYEVKLFTINQTIVLSRNVLVARIGMDPKTVVGCKYLSINEIIDLGFILSEIEQKMAL